MNIVHLLIAALAAWQIVEIWHHSHVFEKWRARAESMANRLGELLGCPFCLSVWVGAFCAFVFHIVEILIGNGHSWAVSLGLPLYMLAVSRLANLGNDLSHDRCRTPGSSVMEGVKFGPEAFRPTILSEWPADPVPASVIEDNGVTLEEANKIMNGEFTLVADGSGYYLYRGDGNDVDAQHIAYLSDPAGALAVYHTQLSTDAMRKRVNTKLSDGAMLELVNRQLMPHQYTVVPVVSRFCLHRMCGDGGLETIKEFDTPGEALEHAETLFDV